MEVAQNINNLPVEEARNINIYKYKYKYKYLSIVMEPIEAQNDINLLIVLEEQIVKLQNLVYNLVMERSFKESGN